MLRLGRAATHPRLLLAETGMGSATPQGSIRHSILRHPSGWWVRRVSPPGVLSPWGQRQEVPPPHSRRDEPPWECPRPSPRSPAWGTCGGKRSVDGVPRLFFGKHRSLRKFIPGVWHTYFFLQQQTATIPVASSTRNPVGWTHGVRSISPPTNSTMRSQNHSRHHHKVPSPPPEGWNWEFFFPGRNLGAASFPPSVAFPLAVE